MSSDFLLLAQDVAPVASDGSSALAGLLAGAVDWKHGALALVSFVLMILALKNKRAATALSILTETANRVDHGETWAQSSVETALAHPADVRALVAGAIPDGLLQKVAP